MVTDNACNRAVRVTIDRRVQATVRFLAAVSGVTGVVFLASPPCPSECGVADATWHQTVKVIG